MNYIEDNSPVHTYEYLGKQCELSYREAHAKNYALALNRSQHRYVKVDEVDVATKCVDTKSIRTRK